MNHKIAMTVFVILVVIAGIVTPSSVIAANKAKIQSVKFLLYKSNGPIYVDIKGYCPEKTYVGYWPLNNTSDYREEAQYGFLNGTVRLWPDMQANTKYGIEIGCVDGNESGVSRYYRVSFKGNRISAIRQ
jgi:hypothetical protein